MERKLAGNTVLKHIRCAQENIAPYVITPGDPGSGQENREIDGLSRSHG